MKKVTLLFFLGLMATAGHAQDAEIILDLTKATTPLEFNATNGSWTGTYDDDAESIDSQVFSFVHSSISDWYTWWGFTASNHADNARPENTLTQQWSNMGKGGIVLDDNGGVKLDSFGAPVVSADVPYLVGFCSISMGAPAQVAFADGKSYEAVSVYVNLNSYSYYTMEYGDSFARAFTNGDKFTLTIHGVSPDETEKTVDVELAAYSNGDLTINRGWKYVDLSELGVVNELYFTLDSTDSGAYGMNTPAYFCLDKLCVRPASESSVTEMSAAANSIHYDRNSHMVTIDAGGFAMIFNAAGHTLMSGEGSIDIRGLEPGVYVVKSGNHSLKIVR